MASKRPKPDDDFLDELISEGTKKDPGFPQLVEAAYRRRKLLRALAGERTRRGISQTRLAAKMNTSQSAVARLEAGRAQNHRHAVEVRLVDEGEDTFLYSAERFLGNRFSGGAFEVLHTALYRTMSTMLPKEIHDAFGEGVRFEHPLPPQYYEADSELGSSRHSARRCTAHYGAAPF